MTETSSEYIDRIAKEYAIYVLDGGRGIPSMYDGLKTSQRIALWLMRNRSGKIKTMALAGEMIASELYLHGDKAGADTISLIAAKWKNNRPLLDGIGGFGSKPEPGRIGQPRYTYVKRNKFAEQNLFVDMDILPMVDNHDGSNQMPGMYLPMIPLVLLNGVKGMATGWSTDILPRDYVDLVRAVKEVVDTGQCRIVIPPPYFEGYDVDVIQDGHNRYHVMGRATVKNTSTVIVTELPPDVTLEEYRGRLGLLEEEGKIAGFTDRSKKDIDIEVKFQRAVLKRLEGRKLIEYLKLRSTMTERIVVIGENGVRQYDDARHLIEDWTHWRLGWYERRYENLRDKALAEELFWLSYIACYEGYGEEFPSVPVILEKSKSRAELKEYMGNLIRANGIRYDEAVCERIVTLPVYRWTVEEYKRAQKEAKAARRRAAEFEKIRKDPEKRRAEFKKDLVALET